MRSPQRLLGHLAARRREVLIQGEVLSTLGLAWLLREPEAARAFGELLQVEGVFSWAADPTVPELGRPDLVGYAAGGSTPLAVVEAKIHEGLGISQLQEYLDWQQTKLLTDDVPGSGVLGVLVPESRRGEAERLVRGLPTTTRCVVVTWEATFTTLKSLSLGEDAVGDLAQLIDLYRQYDDTWVDPFRTDETRSAGWLDRRSDYQMLADLLSVELNDALSAALIVRPRRLQPWQSRGGFRYVTMGHPVAPDLAIGLFEKDLDDVPFAIRYHSGTPGFEDVERRLTASALPVERSSGHCFVRLQLPTGQSHPEMLDDLWAQLINVVKVAQPELSEPLPQTRRPST